MEFSKEFFLSLDFDFNKNLKVKILSFEKSPTLTQKLKNSVFYYKNPNQTNTSFYLFTAALNKKDFDIIRKHVWNENQADLIFYTLETNREDLILFFAKASPLLEIERCIVDTFKASLSDLDKIEKIKRWQFNSGAFWLNYQSFLSRIKYKGIDKELITTLNALKNQLSVFISFIENEEQKKDEIVQAFIDRTLYIKYLEDNHIINSAFYNHYFGDSSISYEVLLAGYKTKEINSLFTIIHKIFNNSLFDKPTIDNKYFSREVCGLIYNSLKANLATQQLRLFDYQFDIIPLEFISYIYEIFLSERQKKNGIYYTPKKLAQLIIDDVIPKDKVGKVLDPSCGSGMFLIVAYQKLLENSKERNFKSIEKRIEHRTKLLSENIFGIEKEVTAQRFTLFSLSLQLFRGLDPVKIREYIANQLDENKEVRLFDRFDLSKNIVCSNALNQVDVPFKGETFDYIVGNPPFFEIKNTNEFGHEIFFLNNYKVVINAKENNAKDIVGQHQISQCFLLKIKEWSNSDSRFGFVSNSSNFYNDNSNVFQNYFYSNYNIEKIYEFSKVKKILFENAKESVVSLIFTNQISKKNIIEYYPVDLGIFSEKPFELLIIQADKSINLSQEELIANEIRLRDFLIGNEYDRVLLTKLSSNVILKSYKKSIHRGFEIWGEDARKKEFNLSQNEWTHLQPRSKTAYLTSFIKKYFNDFKTKSYNKEYIKPATLKPFTKIRSKQFISKLENFHRPRNPNIYFGEKLIFTRLGSSLKCVFSKANDYFDFTVYSLTLTHKKLYYLFCALLNSKLVQFYLDFNHRKRLHDSYSRIGVDDIEQIPIPKELDEELVKQISKICKDLTEGKYEFDNEISNKLNNMIFDLYDLSYLDKQRINDYFLDKAKTTKSVDEIGKYKAILLETVSIYLKNPIEIEHCKTDFGLIVLKITLNKKKEPALDSQKVNSYLLYEIFEQNPTENFLATQEKIYGENCVFIIKKDLNIYWTETKAYEDGREILNNITR